MTERRDDMLRTTAEDAQAVMEKRQPRRRGRDRNWDKAQTKATYRIPEELRDRIKALAHGEGLTADTVVEFALTQFAKDYEAGRIDLEPFKEPRVGTYTLRVGELRS